MIHPSSFPISHLVEIVVYTLAMYVTINDGYDVLEMDLESDKLLECTVWETSAILLTLSWITLLVHLR